MLEAQTHAEAEAEARKAEEVIEELVSRVFATRNAAHLAHWATKSYSEHMALGAFYDAIIDRQERGC